MLSKRLLTVLILTGAFLALLPLSGALASRAVADVQPQTAPPPETVGPNLLTNPGMDGNYVKQCSQRNGPHWVQVPCPADYSAVVHEIKMWETTQVPAGWSAWWREPNNNFDDPNYLYTYPHMCPDWPTTPRDCKPWHNPEYRDTLGGPQDYGPSRKVAGDNSQKYFTFYSVHEAGVYQVVGGVKPGDRLRFAVFMSAWSTGTNDPYQSDLGQRMNLQVGIDPTGGNNPWSPNIIWTAPAESYDRFTQFVVEAVAKNNVVSVWTKSLPDMPLQHADVYVDEASLNVVQPVKAPARTTRVVTSTKIITSTRLITGTDGVVSSVVVTESVIVTNTVPIATTKPVTSTKIVTSTRWVRGSDGVVSQVIVTQSVVVTKTVPVATTQSTKPVTTTKIVTPTKTVTPTRPVTSTAAVSGTLPIPASGKYTVVKGDSLSRIARRYGLTLAVLLALNKDVIKDPNRIEAGWVLRLK